MFEKLIPKSVSWTSLRLWQPILLCCAYREKYGLFWAQSISCLVIWWKIQKIYSHNGRFLWSGWRISIGSVSTPNGRAGWLMYQGSRRWGGWVDSFVSTWAQYSHCTYTLCTWLICTLIVCTLHTTLCTLLVCTLLIYWLLVCALLGCTLLVCEVKHGATQAGMNTWAQTS